MPGSTIEEITLPEVERTLARSLNRLRFPPAIEARFEADTGRSRCRHLAVGVVVGIAVFDLLLISNHRMLPDVFAEALIVKLGVVTPALLAVVLVLRRNPPAWLREWLQVAAYFAIAIASMYLIVKSASPLAAHAHYPLVLAAMYANLVQRLRFWYALGTSVAFFLVYSVGSYHLHSLPPEALSAAIGLMATAMACTLFANFGIERDQRRTYLVWLRDEIRTRWMARANEELSRLTNLDPMIGLANRRGFEQHSTAVWAEAVKAGQSVCVLMLDVDLFKRFNDCYGHQSGDACLRQVAEAARTQMRRADDMVARFGGEEFVVILPGTDFLDGVRIGERIRRAVVACAIPHPTAPAGIVTVSVGAAAQRATLDGSPGKLIERADVALYEAKKRGRNRVWPAAITPGAELTAAAAAHGA